MNRPEPVPECCEPTPKHVNGFRQHTVTCSRFGAKFVLMPDYVAMDQGSKKYVDAEELMTAYGILPYQIATTDQYKAIWLGPRQGGDYKEHLAMRLKARGYT